MFGFVGCFLLGFSLNLDAGAGIEGGVGGGYYPIIEKVQIYILNINSSLLQQAVDICF